MQYYRYLLVLMMFGNFFITSLLFSQPLQHRLLIAVSEDGLIWTRLNQIMNDSADVPDAVLGPGNNVYAYFQGLWTPLIDGITVGISPNGLDSWTFYQVSISGTAGWGGRPCDPDIIFRADTFRLYFTGDPINDMRPETYSAVSTDGINFTIESGVRFEVPGSPIMDPSLLWTGDTLQYFAGGAPPGWNWHGHSLDGVSFTHMPNFIIDSLLMSNGIPFPGGYRFYGFRNWPREGIGSAFSTNGEIWSMDAGYRLNVDTTAGLESLYVKDPAVVFKDTIYIMYYVTRRPNHAGAISENGTYIEKFRIDAFPNPFNSSCAITVNVEDACMRPAMVEIFDLRGNVVYVSPHTSNSFLPEEKGEPANAHTQSISPWGERFIKRGSSFVWTPDNSISSGIYLICATTQEAQTITKRIAYLK